MIKARIKAANTIGHWWKKKLLKIREKKIAFKIYFRIINQFLIIDDNLDEIIYIILIDLLAHILSLGLLCHQNL